MLAKFSETKRKVIVFRRTKDSNKMAMNAVNSTITADEVFHRGVVGDGVNFAKDEEGYFSLETEICSSPVGNCRKCYSLGVMHDWCRCCHSKTNPSYYTATAMRGTPDLIQGTPDMMVHPIYLAHCAKKPMDIPITQKDVEEYKYKRSEEEIMTDSTNTLKHYITMEECCIKVSMRNIPNHVQQRMQRLDRTRRNASFCESVILSDDQSKYFTFRIIPESKEQPGHFALFPTTLQQSHTDPGLA